MTTPYKEIVNANGILPECLRNKIRWTLPASLGGIGIACPGRTIMATANANGLFHDPFLKLFYTFSRFPGGWAWKPAAGGHDFNGLLDNVPESKLSGECLHFVENLYTLCRAPAPYGLGMDCTELVIIGTAGKGGAEAYAGEFKKGFVSVHDGVYHGLQSNVVPGPSYMGRPLYSWENHKVLWVKSRDLYYDPCYGNNYQNLEDMAAYHFTGRDFIMDGTGDIFQAFSRGIFMEEAKKNGRYFYFRRLSDAEQQHYPNKSVMGPYTETECHMACERLKGIKVLK